MDGKELMSPLPAEGLLALDGCWVRENHFAMNFNREKKDLMLDVQEKIVTGVNMTKMHCKGKRKKKLSKGVWREHPLVWDHNVCVGRGSFVTSFSICSVAISPGCT